MEENPFGKNYEKALYCSADRYEKALKEYMSLYGWECMFTWLPDDKKYTKKKYEWRYKGKSTITIMFYIRRVV